MFELFQFIVQFESKYLPIMPVNDKKLTGLFSYPAEPRITFILWAMKGHTPDFINGLQRKKAPKIAPRDNSSRPFVLWGYRGPQPLGGGDGGEAEPPCLLTGMDGLSIQESGSKGLGFSIIADQLALQSQRKLLNYGSIYMVCIEYILYCILSENDVLWYHM